MHFRGLLRQVSVIEGENFSVDFPCCLYYHLIKRALMAQPKVA